LEALCEWFMTLRWSLGPRSGNSYCRGQESTFHNGLLGCEMMLRCAWEEGKIAWEKWSARQTARTSSATHQPQNYKMQLVGKDILEWHFVHSPRGFRMKPPDQWLPCRLCKCVHGWWLICASYNPCSKTHAVRGTLCTSTR